MNIKAQAIIILGFVSTVESRINGASILKGTASQGATAQRNLGGGKGGGGGGGGKGSGGSGTTSSGDCGGATCSDNEFCQEDPGVCGDGSTGSCTVIPDLCFTLFDPVLSAAAMGSNIRILASPLLPVLTLPLNPNVNRCKKL